MRNKLTIILFSLLLAVGWTNTAQAQKLPESAAERYGVKPIERADERVQLSLEGDQEKPVSERRQVVSDGGIASLDVPNCAPRVMTVVNQYNGQGIMMNAPMRAQGYTLTTAQAEALTYDWTDEDANKTYTDVPSTQVAKNPYQIYELLKFIYKTPDFPGPYTSAYTSGGQPEDPVYYGGIAGGWDIPFESPNYTTTTLNVGAFGVIASSYNVRFRSIKVYNAYTNTLLSSWDYNGSTYQSSGGSYNYELPDGWSRFNPNDPSSIPYFRRGGSSDYYGYITTGTNPGGINITPGGKATRLRVVISAYGGSSGETITIDNDPRTLSTSESTYTWYIDGPTGVDKETTPTEILITLNNSDAYINYIKVLDACTGELLTKWENSTTLTSGWFGEKSLTRVSLDGTNFYRMTGGGTIRIPPSFFTGSDSIKVIVNARGTDDDNTGRLQIANDLRYWTLKSTAAERSVTIRFPEVIPSETYKPIEGYTVLVVAVKNDAPVDYDVERFENAFEFTTKAELINYFRNSIDSVKLLTDGMRIGSGVGAGTVYNCSGTYNKFFFLGKGQARKKSNAVYAGMGWGSHPWPSYAGERAPFKFMFEEFSPTSGAQGSQIEDFYSEMMDGHVYPVVHDCAAVIDNGHQFSLSGNAGTESFAFKGMNFFVPDYRLLYWQGRDSIKKDGVYTYFNCDGRVLNPYMICDEYGSTGVANDQASTFAAEYAQYNPAYAPKVGIYLITLEATAKPTTGYDPDDPSTRFFDITLTWTSSLDEMTNSSVPQSFTIYYLDDKGDRHLLGTGEIPINVTNPTGSLTLTYPWPQEATSQTFTYIVEGRGTGDHSPFVAWSNQDDVTIPGYDDFLALGQEHIESDFDIHNQCNWYRNFLLVSSENELNGLKYTEVAESPNQQMQFKLYRSVVNPAPTSGSEPEEVEVATLTFKNPTATTVDYEIVYSPGQEIEPYTLKKNDNTTVTGAYERDKMGIDDYGTLRVIGNGDLVIQPNGYNVNFKSITVKNGDNVVASWTVADGDITAGNSAWNLSPGSMWVEHMTDQGEKTYYLEGGGYLYIPNLLNQYNQLTVEIEAFGDGSTIARVLVNDESQRFQNNTPEVITWTVNRSNRGGNNAPIIKSNN